MARYGTFPYTAGVLYGPSSASLYVAHNFVAKSKTYNTVDLSWDTPLGAWNRLRLVRSSYGFPAFPNDGTVLFDKNSGTAAVGVKDVAINAFTDRDLTPGRYYYYSLFVEYSEGTNLHYARGGDALGLAVTDRDYLDYLLRRLPSVYTNDDMQVDGQPSRSSTPLTKFLSLFSFEIARYRDVLESLRDVNDPDATNGLLLPSMGGQLSYAYEPEIGMRQNRVLLRNATYIAERKGTLLAVASLFTSVTGYGATVNPLRNLLHDDNDANAQTTIGRWTATGATLSRNTSLAGPTDSAYTSATGVLQLTATATSAAVSLYDASTAIPVTAGEQYCVSAYLRSAATPVSPSLIITWYDASGAVVTTTTTALSATSTSAWHRGYSAPVAAPALSVGASLRLSYPTLTVSAVHYIKAVQFEPTAVSDYRPAREVLVDLVAPRVNEIANPTFDAVLAGTWSGDGTTTLTVDATVARERGLNSMKILSSVDGSTYVMAPGDCESDASFAASGYVCVSAATQVGARVEVLFYDVDGNPVGSTQVGSATTVGTDWTRVSYVGRTPVGATSFHLKFVFPNANIAHPLWLDDVLFEHSSYVDDYFDRRYNSLDAFLEDGASVYPARTHLYPLFSARKTRALQLAQDSVALGTTVAVRWALPR